MPYDTTVRPSQVDGILYANAALMPAAEGDLSTMINTAVPRSPLFVGAGSNATATVVFTAQGALAALSAAYVVMQTQVGDENGPWIDVAWCGISAVPVNTNAPTFLLASGQFGPNAFQQTRLAGTAPSSTLGSNVTGLGGRLRFVGKATGVNFGSSSSSMSSATVGPGLLVTIRCKIQGLR